MEGGEDFANKLTALYNRCCPHSPLSHPPLPVSANTPAASSTHTRTIDHSRHELAFTLPLTHSSRFIPRQAQNTANMCTVQTGKRNDTERRGKREHHSAMPLPHEKREVTTGLAQIQTERRREAPPNSAHHPYPRHAEGSA
jgi:hypothetical protein